MRTFLVTILVTLLLMAVYDTEGKAHKIQPKAATNDDRSEAEKLDELHRFINNPADFKHVFEMDKNNEIISRVRRIEDACEHAFGRRDNKEEKNFSDLTRQELLAIYNAPEASIYDLSYYTIEQLKEKSQAFLEKATKVVREVDLEKKRKKLESESGGKLLIDFLMNQIDFSSLAYRIIGKQAIKLLKTIQATAAEESAKPKSPTEYTLKELVNLFRYPQRGITNISPDSKKQFVELLNSFIDNAVEKGSNIGNMVQKKN